MNKMLFGILFTSVCNAITFASKTTTASAYLRLCVKSIELQLYLPDGC